MRTMLHMVSLEVQTFSPNNTETDVLTSLFLVLRSAKRNKCFVLSFLKSLKCFCLISSELYVSDSTVLFFFIYNFLECTVFSGWLLHVFNIYLNYFSKFKYILSFYFKIFVVIRYYIIPS